MNLQKEAISKVVEQIMDEYMVHYLKKQMPTLSTAQLVKMLLTANGRITIKTLREEIKRREQHNGRIKNT